MLSFTLNCVNFGWKISSLRMVKELMRNKALLLGKSPSEKAISLSSLDKASRRKSPGDGKGGGGDRTKLMAVGLQRALEDGNPKTRRNAAETLGKMGRGAIGALNALCVVAGSDENKDVRRRCVEALGRIGEALGRAGGGGVGDVGAGAVALPGAVCTVLGEAVLGDVDLIVRRQAAVALSRLGEDARPAMRLLREASIELGGGGGAEMKKADVEARRKVWGLVDRVLRLLSKGGESDEGEAGT